MNAASICEALNLIIDKRMKLPISNKLREFAKEHFPDIDDELIQKNYCELSNNLKNGLKRDGHELVMHMDRNGNIDTIIRIPKFFYHKTNGVPDNFNKVFGKGEGIK